MNTSNLTTLAGTLSAVFSALHQSNIAPQWSGLASALSLAALGYFSQGIKDSGGTTS